MNFAIFSTHRHFVLLLFVFLAGSVVVYTIADHIDENAIERRDSELQSVNRRAAFEFSESLDRFVYLMSGIRSYVNHTEPFPTQEELQSFVVRQMHDLNYKDSLIISFIDQDHVFRYSFTPNTINSADLIGTSVRDIRSQAAIQRLDSVMMDEQFRLFPVTNLFEGWVGIPIDFNVMRNGKSTGYIAAIADFKSIIEPIYTFESSDEFVFKFSVNQTEFDRERAYDRTKVYHDRKDTKYYKNYLVNEEQFVTSKVERYGLTFLIGTAFINNYKQSQNLSLLIYGWYLMIVCFVSYSLFRLNRFKKLNEAMKRSIDTIELQKSKLDLQNEELNQLNATKDKFFSIIGHDLKGPLTSIASVVGLWNAKALDGGEIDEIMKNLETATKGASSLLDNLLLWAMVNTGQINWKPENISLNEVVQEVYFQLSGGAMAKRIKLVSQVGKECQLHGDRNMLSTIIRNLVSNAIKFTKLNSEVNVTGFVEQDQVVLNISDQGDGLNEKEISMLFEQGEALSGGGKRTGTGLGLILVAEFVNRHKGVISIKSQSGDGATFTIAFPINEST